MRRAPGCLGPRGIGGEPISTVRSLLERHPTLMGELSYRPGLTRPMH